MSARSLVRAASEALVRLTAPGSRPGPNLARYTMYRRIATAVRPLAVSGRVLSISGSAHLASVAGIHATEIVDASYPEYNILELPFADGEFDVVLSDQVLEHVAGDPKQAFDECFRVLRKGGLAIHTTAFMMALHGSPHDFWRFSPDALRWLCKDAERIVECGGWGNPLLPIAYALGLGHVPVPEKRWHPLNVLATYARESYHHVVWVVAQK